MLSSCALWGAVAAESISQVTQHAPQLCIGGKGGPSSCANTWSCLTNSSLTPRIGLTTCRICSINCLVSNLNFRLCSPPASLTTDSQPPTRLAATKPTSTPTSQPAKELRDLSPSLLNVCGRLMGIVLMLCNDVCNLFTLRNPT